jgi:hypothetical protein
MATNVSDELGFAASRLAGYLYDLSARVNGQAMSMSDARLGKQWLDLLGIARAVLGDMIDFVEKLPISQLTPDEPGSAVGSGMPSRPAARAALVDLPPAAPGKMIGPMPGPNGRFVHHP